MALLTLNDIHIAIGDRQLLAGASLLVGERDRIGLLGPPNRCAWREDSSWLGPALCGEQMPDSPLAWG